MTDKRAKEYLGEQKERFKLTMAAEMSEALECADKALEKRIPATPDIQGDGYAYGDDSGNIVMDTWICPSCQASYEIDDDYDYCPKCGQAIKQNVVEQYR